MVVLSLVIIVSAQVLLVLTLGLWDFGLGLDNIYKYCSGQGQGELLDVRGDDSHSVSHPALCLLETRHLGAHLHQTQHPGEPHKERVRPGGI